MVAVAVVAAACSTPRVGRDDLPTGKERVQELLGDALTVLPGTADYILPEAPGTQACRRTFLGFAVGDAGTRRAEYVVIADVPAGTETTTFLDEISRRWAAQGYRVEPLETADDRFPKVQAHDPEGYRVVMTAFTNTPRVTVYAVSPCLRDS